MNEPLSLNCPCGHDLHMTPHASSGREELLRAAALFPCPFCCRLANEAAGLFPAVYVNMQRLSEEMSAFVIEVSEVGAPLNDLLALTGYAERASSRDELTPGGQVESGAGTVWRKEFWFATATNPFHVIALIELVKEESYWLAGYLPDAAAVHFMDFPQS